MDFNKPIFAEIEGESGAKDFRYYLESHGIEFKETTDNYEFASDLDCYMFECVMTNEQLLSANRDTDALFYQ